MVNVFGDSIPSGTGNLQVVKKVVVTVSKYKDYIDEIQQRLQKNVCAIYVTPIRVYDGKVIVLDNVATMKVGDQQVGVNWDIGSSGDIVALQGDRGTSGAWGFKGDSGDRGPTGIQGPTG